MKNRIVREETKLKMSISAKNRLKREGKLSHFERKKHSEKSLALMKRFKVEITDIEKNKISTYNSIQSAVKGIGYAISSVLRWEAKYKDSNVPMEPFKGKYYIKIFREKFFFVYSH